MSDVVKTVVPSLATKLPCDAHRSHNLFAGEVLAAGDACYIKASDGLVYKAIGTAVNAAAKVDGFTAMAYETVGMPVTLYHNVELAYGPTTLAPGTRLFLSAAVAGALADAASTGGTGSIATSISVSPLTEGTRSAVIFVYKSTY